MAINNTKSTTLPAVTNKLTGESFTELPSGSVVKLNNFNLVCQSAPKLSRRGQEVDGDIIMTIQLSTKASMEAKIKFEQEMVMLWDAIEAFEGGVNEAFLEILSISIVRKDSNNRDKLVAPIGALHQVLGL